MLHLCLLLFSTSLFAQELPFAQALKQMVEQNVSVQIQQTKLEASGAQLNAARGTFTPQIFLQAQQQSGGGGLLGAEGAPVYATTQMYTANATWNLFRSGADAAAVSAAHQDRGFQQAALDDSYLQAEDRAARALLDYVEKKQIVEALGRSESNALHFLEIARARFARSLLPREEAEKVYLDAANAEAKRADAELELNAARAAVESLLGHATVRGDWPWEKIFDETSLRELRAPPKFEDLLNRRPDYRAARFAVDREDQRSRSYFRTMFPKIDLTYSVGDTRTGGQTTTAWSSLATLTIPLWSGLSDYSAYRVQVESKYAAEHQLHQLERDVKSSVEAAQANFAVSLKQFQVRTRNLGVAKHILEQDGARFKIGRADANELNLDLSRVTAAEILAIQGIQNAHLAYMQLIHVFGQRLP